MREWKQRFHSQRLVRMPSELPYNPIMWRLLLAVFCLAMGLGCKKIPRPVDDYQAGQAAAKAARMPKDPADAKVFTELKTAGHDFSKPTEVHFYLYFPDESAARGVIHVLSSDGYAGELRQSNGQHLAFLKKTMVLDAEAIDMERFKMRDLTVNSGGEYDGWEAAVVK